MRVELELGWAHDFVAVRVGVQPMAIGRARLRHEEGPSHLGSVFRVCFGHVDDEVHVRLFFNYNS